MYRTQKDHYRAVIFLTEEIYILMQTIMYIIYWVKDCAATNKNKGRSLCTDMEPAPRFKYKKQDVQQCAQYAPTHV